MSNFRGVSEGDVIRFAYAKREPLRVEHEAFRDAVLGDDRGIVTMLDGLRTVEVAEAMPESARDGRQCAGLKRPGRAVARAGCSDRRRAGRPRPSPAHSVR